MAEETFRAAIAAAIALDPAGAETVIIEANAAAFSIDDAIAKAETVGKSWVIEIPAFGGVLEFLAKRKDVTVFHLAEVPGSLFATTEQLVDDRCCVLVEGGEIGVLKEQPRVPAGSPGGGQFGSGEGGKSAHDATRTANTMTRLAQQSGKPKDHALAADAHRNAAAHYGKDSQERALHLEDAAAHDHEKGGASAPSSPQELSRLADQASANAGWLGGQNTAALHDAAAIAHATAASAHAAAGSRQTAAEHRQSAAEHTKQADRLDAAKKPGVGARSAQQTRAASNSRDRTARAHDIASRAAKADESELDLGTEHDVRLLKTTAEERYVLGVVLVPEVKDSQGDIYSHDEVRKAAHDYMENAGTLGRQHTEVVTGRLKILESYLVPADFKQGEEVVTKGTWLMGIRVIDDELWTGVKKGSFTGFSIGGAAHRSPDKS